MHPFIIYILKSAFITGIFYGYYHLLLRNKKLHTFNRFYILSAIVLSMLAPLLHIEWATTPITNNPSAIKLLQVIGASGYDEQPLIAATNTFQFSTLAWQLYFATVLVMLVVLAAKIVQLYNAKRNAVVTKRGNVDIIESTDKAAPFSFLNTIFWKSDIDIDSPMGKNILRHELAHIQQYHTVDKLFTRIILAFFWMNPFYWLFDKELSMVHEFLADEGCIENNDTSAFAEMLLHAHFGNKLTGIIQPFFHSPIKRRLTMLHKTNATRHAALRRLSVVPVVAATVLLFSFSVKEKVARKTTHQTVIIVDAGHGGQDDGASNAAGIKEKDLTLKISQTLARLAPEYNIDVLQTRTDNYPSLESRAKAAMGTNASLFISVHVNKDEPNEPKHQGYELYVCNKNIKYNECKLLASAIMGTLNSAQTTLKEKNLMVLKGNSVPAVLIECGNIDNVQDLATLQDDQQLEQMCRKILAGVVQYSNVKK